MLRFAVRRLLLLVPILIGLSLLVFIWIRALPGSPAEALLGERATDESIAQVRDQYGLDDPFYEQYWRYLQTIGSGDFGTSIASRRPITEEITERFPATIELAIGAMLFATFIGIPLGFLAAKRHGSSVDHASLFLSLIGVSIPIFFLALILKWVFAVELGWLPSVGRQDVLIDAEHPTNFYVLDGIITRNWEAAWDAVKHLILPAIALGSIPLAIIARITRASVLDVQNEDYVRTARAKGISSRAVDTRHVLRNAMLPDLDHHRPPGGLAALGRDPHGDGLRLPRDRHVAAGGDREPRLPGDPGRCAVRRVHRRAREPARRHLVRAAQPAHQTGGPLADVDRRD